MFTGICRRHGLVWRCFWCSCRVGTGNSDITFTCNIFYCWNFNLCTFVLCNASMHMFVPHWYVEVKSSTATFLESVATHWMPQISFHLFSSLVISYQPHSFCDCMTQPHSFWVLYDPLCILDNNSIWKFKNTTYVNTQQIIVGQCTDIIFIFFFFYLTKSIPFFKKKFYLPNMIWPHTHFS